MATITTRNGQSIPIHVNPEGGDAEPTIIVPKNSVKVWTNAKGDYQWEISAKGDYPSQTIGAFRQMLDELEQELRKRRS